MFFITIFKKIIHFFLFEGQNASFIEITIFLIRLYIY